MLSVYFWSCSVDYRTCICDMQTPCHHVHFPIIFANGCKSFGLWGVRIAGDTMRYILFGCEDAGNGKFRRELG